MVPGIQLELPQTMPVEAPIPDAAAGDFQSAFLSAVASDDVATPSDGTMAPSDELAAGAAGTSKDSVRPGSRKGERRDDEDEAASTATDPQTSIDPQLAISQLPVPVNPQLPSAPSITVAGAAVEPADAVSQPPEANRPDVSTPLFAAAMNVAGLAHRPLNDAGKAEKTPGEKFRSAAQASDFGLNRPTRDADVVSPKTSAAVPPPAVQGSQVSADAAPAMMTNLPGTPAPSTPAEAPTTTTSPERATASDTNSATENTVDQGKAAESVAMPVAADVEQTRTDSADRATSATMPAGLPVDFNAPRATGEHAARQASAPETIRSTPAHAPLHSSQRPTSEGHVPESTDVSKFRNSLDPAATIATDVVLAPAGANLTQPSDRQSTQPPNTVQAAQAAKPEGIDNSGTDDSVPVAQAPVSDAPIQNAPAQSSQQATDAPRGANSDDILKAFQFWSQPDNTTSQPTAPKPTDATDQKEAQENVAEAAIQTQASEPQAKVPGQTLSDSARYTEAVADVLRMAGLVKRPADAPGVSGTADKKKPAAVVAQPPANKADGNSQPQAGNAPSNVSATPAPSAPAPTRPEDDSKATGNPLRVTAEHAKQIAIQELPGDSKSAIGAPATSADRIVADRPLPVPGKKDQHAANTNTSAADKQPAGGPADPLAAPPVPAAHVNSPAKPDEAAGAIAQAAVPPSPKSADNHGLVMQQPADRNRYAGTLPSQDQNLPVIGINTARLIQRMNESEMRVGLQTEDLGNISVRTSLAHEQITAEISVEHDVLGKAISDHLPALQSKLGEDYGINTRIEIQERSAGFSGDAQRQSQQQAQQWQPVTTARGLAEEKFEFEKVSAAPAVLVPNDSRLDIRV